ncbi:10639_t:CDS:1, partial [Scutellospora calospora]
VIKEHAKATYNIQPNANTLLKSEKISFSKAIKIMTEVLYKYEVMQKLFAF